MVATIHQVKEMILNFIILVGGIQESLKQFQYIIANAQFQVQDKKHCFFLWDVSLVSE